MTFPPDWIVPEWPAPNPVRAVVTTRRGGFSAGRYASLNLGDHVGDDPNAVLRNRALLERHLPHPPLWLHQVHGTAVADAATSAGVPSADASVTRIANAVCAVLVADCLPVLLCDAEGTVVAAAHAGWRGLCAGVVENAVAAMGAAPESILAWLGPAIGPTAFEVGNDVRDAFLAGDSRASAAFAPTKGGKWLADLYGLARRRLEAIGVRRVYGGGWCTFSDPERFFSYRRDGATGRMAALVWRTGEAPVR